MSASLAVTGQTTPPASPLVLTRAGCWCRGQKCGNTGSPCLDRPMLPRGTYHGTPLHDYKTVPKRPAHTPEHKSTWNYSCTNTFTPILTLHAARTKLHTTVSIGSAPQKRRFQKRPKRAATRVRRVWTSPCSDKGGVHFQKDEKRGWGAQRPRTGRGGSIPLHSRDRMHLVDPCL